MTNRRIYTLMALATMYLSLLVLGALAVEQLRAVLPALGLEEFIGWLP